MMFRMMADWLGCEPGYSFPYTSTARPPLPRAYAPTPKTLDQAKAEIRAMREIISKMGDLR